MWDDVGLYTVLSLAVHICRAKYLESELDLGHLVITAALGHC